MMNILTIPVGPLGTNCYIVTDENNRGIIIDPGFEAWKIEEKLKEKNVQIEYIVLTHGHYDHFAAVEKLLGNLKAKIVIHEEDAPYLENPNLSLLCWFDALSNKTIKADITVNDTSTLMVGDLAFSFMHTPGHTQGSMCIIIENTIFTGDTLFRMDIGRADLPGGDYETLLHSLKRIAKIEGEYDLYPGHMGKSTLSYEKANNTYLR